MSFSASVAVLILSATASLSQAVVVLTPNGIIIGSDKLRSRNGKVIYSFVGIPYAQPPVGTLRFKESQPVTPWETPIIATKKCSACPQVVLFGDSEGQHIGEENCLCLNVYSTSLRSNLKLPVMFFIHGGVFKTGTSGVEPDFLADEVVLVDLNYRLGALGFSTTGDGIIPGNLGIKDQLLALKWVQKNIEYFGGDPNLVTVFGASAGGASTHLILLSPLSKGLVHRGISMSGTATCPWALSPQQVVVERTKALGMMCGCPPEPSEKLLECLQNVPLKNILDASDAFSDEVGLPVAAFGPIIESPNTKNALIIQHPNELPFDIPWITGLVATENSGFPSRFVSYVERHNLDLEEQVNLIIPKFLQVDSRFTKEEIPSIVYRLKKFYFGDEPITMENIFKMDFLVGDMWFMSGLVESTLHHKGTTYLHYYDYHQSNVSFSEVYGQSLSNTGVSHQDDLLNLFPLLTTFPNRTLSKTDLEVSEKYVYLWTTFAKSGNLTRNSLTKWNPLDKRYVADKYLHITGQEFKQMRNLLIDRTAFWAYFGNFRLLV